VVRAASSTIAAYPFAFCPTNHYILCFTFVGIMKLLGTHYFYWQLFALQWNYDGSVKEH